MTHLNPESLVIFTIDEQRFALSVSVVERVVRAVEVTPLPGAPAAVRGIIDVHGDIIPVFDVRSRLGMATREVRTTDHLIIARAAMRRIALLVDVVTDVAPLPAEDAGNLDSIFPQDSLLVGVVKLPGDIALVQDLERFLSAEQWEMLHTAMAS